MKNRIFAIIFAIAICISMIPSASAYNRHVFDMTENCLTTSELDELGAMAQDIEDDYGYCVLFGITDYVDAETNYAFAEQYYEEVGTSEYGMMLLHNTGDSEYVVYTTDEASAVFNDDVTATLGGIYNENETYYGGVYEYYKAVEQTLLNVDNAPADTEDTTEFVPVERTLPLVVDNADLLSDSEEAELIASLETLTSTYQIEAGVLTVSDLEGKTPQAYADDFYDYNGYGYGKNDDGLLVLYKPGEEGERELYITTHGKAIDIFSDDDIDIMLGNMKDYLIAEEYSVAFDTFVSDCEYFIVEFDTPATVQWFWIPVCLVVGFLISLIVTAIIASSLKTVRSQRSASSYVRQGSMIVTGQQDVFLYSNVVKTAIEKDDGDSSTHTSSSGRTHGGGGTSF